MVLQLLNVQKHHMTSIMTKITSITKKVIKKLWKHSAGKRIIIKTV